MHLAAVVEVAVSVLLAVELQVLLMELRKEPKRELWRVWRACCLA